MTKFHIVASYEYDGVVEADTQEEALNIFHKELNDHYSMALDEDVMQLCDECEEDKDFCYCEETD